MLGVNLSVLIDKLNAYDFFICLGMRLMNDCFSINGENCLILSHMPVFHQLIANYFKISVSFQHVGSKLRRTLLN